MHLTLLPRTLALIIALCVGGLAQLQISASHSQSKTPGSQESPKPDAGSSPHNGPQEPSDNSTTKPPARPVPENPEQQAWDLLEKAVHSDKVSERTTSVSALSLLPDNTHALKLAEAALLDDKAEVRAAAAVTLGELRSKSSIPKLRSMLEDKDPSVVLAATHALQQMHDEAAYDVYYEILTGERKVSKGLIASQTSILHDPKKLAKLGIEEGISNAVPFGGFGVEAYRLMSKNEGARLRASAARELADDPDPASTKALTNAAGDNDWTVRASALEALAKRGDPSALKTVELYMYDDRSEVKYNAAAATLRLLAIRGARHQEKPTLKHDRSKP